jgi:hypothetical protein
MTEADVIETRMHAVAAAAAIMAAGAMPAHAHCAASSIASCATAGATHSINMVPLRPQLAQAAVQQFNHCVDVALAAALVSIPANLIAVLLAVVADEPHKCCAP